MTKAAFNPDNFFKNACIFEASLILVALVIGWLAGVNPFVNLKFSELAVGYGIVGTIPLFLLFLWLERLSHNAVATIRNFLLDTLGPALHRHDWGDLFVLAAIAGISEEILFRGVIQPWLEGSVGVTLGLILSNIVFGLVHAITPLYAVLATLVGLYLGLSLDFGGERNLLTPIVIHWLYDFLAFIALIRTYKKYSANPDNTKADEPRPRE